jgi:gamma-glutamylcyclotransferase (GGCT)/AIG2-like uncharacterized protein YtfP
MYYASYGSNLNHEQMSRRCPKAKFIGIGQLLNYRLVFRGVADIEFSKGSVVPIGLWKITKECLQALDMYEGYPHHYGRGITEIKMKHKYKKAFIYFMNYDGYSAPTKSYYDAIHQGYLDCKLNTLFLEEAWKFTRDNLDERKHDEALF